MCRKSCVFILAHYLAISLELLIVGSQEFPQLDGLIEERIEEDFIHEHGNDIEMIQNSILEIDTSDQVRIDVYNELVFFKLLKKFPTKRGLKDRGVTKI